MRSIFENVPFLRRGHMIAASVPAHAPNEPDTGCRMVQTPSWLNLRATQIGDARLKVVSHQKLFSQSLNQSDLYDYDNGALPK